jgi:hypothetical protein
MMEKIIFDEVESEDLSNERVVEMIEREYKSKTLEEIRKDILANIVIIVPVPDCDLSPKVLLSA